MTQDQTKKLLQLLESLNKNVELISKEFLKIQHENQMKKVDAVLIDVFTNDKIQNINLIGVKLKDLEPTKPFLTGNPLRKHLKTDRVKPFENGINFCECLDFNGESCYILETTQVFINS